MNPRIKELLEQARIEISRWIEDQSILLSKRELKAAIKRIDVVLELGKFPEPSKDWPAIPWPIF